jgi:phosphatidylglycerophosphate synthase
MVKNSLTNLAKHLLIVSDSPIKLWGLTGAERVQRAASQVMRQHGEPRPWLALRGDHAYETRLLDRLLDAPGTQIIDPQSHQVLAVCLDLPDATALEAPRADLTHWNRDALPRPYDKALRRSADSYVEPLVLETLPALERRMFHAVYKGATDIVTKYVWPLPAFYVTRTCARLGIAPNMITSVALILTILATWFFWHGEWAPGLIAAWTMTFLDTVDGKLARLTLTDSKFGRIFDHGLDIIHPPIWYGAWWWGVNASPGLIVSATPLFILFGSYVAGRIFEDIFRRSHGFNINSWRPIDQTFRAIGARRNLNLILLTICAAVGRPDLGLIGVAAWHALTAVWYGVRMTMGFVARSRAGAPQPWQEPAL